MLRARTHWGSQRMAITWDPTLALGIEEIDAQHEELFRRVDALLESVQERRSAEETRRMLAFLDAYVVEHFGAEEALMQAHRYPGLAAQRAEHAGFAADLAALREELERDGMNALLVVRVNARVATWLFEHISRSDRAFGRFLLAAPAARA